MELSKETIKKLLFIISFALLLLWGLNHFSSVTGLLKNLFGVLAPFLLGLIMAFVINVLLRPVEKVWEFLWKKQNKKGRLKRPVCLLISTILIIGIIFIILFMIVPEIQRTAATVINMFPEYMSQLEKWWSELSVILAEHSIILPQPELDLNELGKMAAGFLSESGHSFLNKTLDITTSIFSGIFNVVLGLVFAFYVLSQKEKLGRHIIKTLQAFLSSEKVSHFTKFAALVNKTFTNFVTGQLTEAVIIGLLCFAGMSLFRMPYAPMISVLVGFTALIPVFGAFLGTIVGAMLIVMISPVKALWFIVFIIVLQQLEGDFIYPKVVGKSVGLPGIWVLAAVTVGGGLFGILGMLLSVPVCSVVYCIGKETVNQRLRKKGLDIIKD